MLTNLLCVQLRELDCVNRSIPEAFMIALEQRYALLEQRYALLEVGALRQPRSKTTAATHFEPK